MSHLSTEQPYSVALVVARARNGVIGKNNQLPWHLPNDLAFFKRITMNKPLIMGRNTWQSLGKPLPGRDNIVVTRQTNFQAEGAWVVHSIESALTLASTLADARHSDEIMIIGGAQLYADAMPFTTRAYMTEVDADIEGDTFFPTLNHKEWRETFRESFAACKRNAYPYSFITLERNIKNS
jgi:dihydrofolate reductase